MKLFTVGPTEMYPQTLAKSAQQLPYFRTSEFSGVVLELERLLLDLVYAPVDSRALFLTASGTGAMEAVVINILQPTDYALVVDGGSFGNRFSKLCQCHNIPQEALSLPFGTALKREMLDYAYRDGMTALLINLHETSTGQLYDLEMVSNFCQEHNLLLIVDAISSFLADEVNMCKAKIDGLILSSQKALALEPGISMVVLSPRAIQLTQARGAQMMYFDFCEYLKEGERGQTPYTPAVGILLTMHGRLSEISRMGLSAVRAGIRMLAEDFRAKVRYLPIQIPDYPLSFALTPVLFDNGKASEIYGILRQDYAITVTPSGGELSDKFFRVGHIGNLTIEDNDRLIQAMVDILSRF